MSSDTHSHFDGLSSLISFAGITVPARARFIAQFVGSTLFSSITVGLVAGQTGAALLACGPLIPFITGSWAGYTWGCVGFWKQNKKKTLTCARRYPKVLAHFMLTNFDMEVPKNGNGAIEGEQSLEDWIIQGGVGRLSYAILATQGCEEDIAEMQKNERQKLVDAYSSEMD